MGSCVLWGGRVRSLGFYVRWGLLGGVRILHTVHAYPPEVGGTEVVLERLSRGLVRRGHRVVVATGEHPKRDGSVGGVPVRGFPVTPRGVLAYRRWVLKGVREGRWDVVMTYHSKVWSHLALFPFSEALAKRWVYAPVEFTDVESRHPRHVAYYGVVEPLSLRRAARAWTLTRGDEDRALEMTEGRASVVRIPNGVDHAWWAKGEVGDVLERWGLPLGVPLVTFVGGFWEHKDVGTLVEAIKHLDEHHLVLAGDPRGRAERVRLLAQEHGVLDRVHLLGRVSREDVRALFHASAVHASASWNEGFGLTFVEAMACGLPVVARATGVIPELVDQGATVEVAADPWGFAEAIERLSGQGAGNVDVAWRYDWSRIVDEVEAMYREVSEA